MSEEVPFRIAPWQSKVIPLASKESDSRSYVPGQSFLSSVMPESFTGVIQLHVGPEKPSKVFGVFAWQKLILWVAP